MYADGKQGAGCDDEIDHRIDQSCTSLAGTKRADVRIIDALEELLKRGAVFGVGS